MFLGCRRASASRLGRLPLPRYSCFVAAVPPCASPSGTALPAVGISLAPLSSARSSVPCWDEGPSTMRAPYPEVQLPS